MPASPAPDPLVDAAGVRHQPAGADARIVSLVPSITELLFDLGLGGSVVGRTAFCAHPEGRVKAVRSVGGTKQVNRGKLARARPTHVIVNVDETPKSLADEIAATGARVIVTHPIAVEDNRALYRLVGGVFGREGRAEALCRAFDAAYEDAGHRAEALPERRVLYLIWRAPWMTVSADTYIARMLALVRWRAVGGDGAARYPTVEMTEALLDGVDLVLFSSEPFPFTERHVEEFRGTFPAHAAKARTIDAQMVSWYGSRAVAGINYITDLAQAEAEVIDS